MPLDIGRLSVRLHHHRRGLCRWLSYPFQRGSVYAARPLAPEYIPWSKEHRHADRQLTEIRGPSSPRPHLQELHSRREIQAATVAGER